MKINFITIFVIFIFIVLTRDMEVDVTVETVSLSFLLKLIWEQQGSMTATQSQLESQQRTIDMQRDTIHRYLLDSCPCPARKPEGPGLHLVEETVPSTEPAQDPSEGNNLNNIFFVQVIYK